MPTILRERGFRLFFYSNEGNEPPHVHVESGDGTAKFWLDNLECAYTYGLKASELRTARMLIKEHRETLLERWYEHFGTP